MSHLNTTVTPFDLLQSHAFDIYNYVSPYITPYSPQSTFEYYWRSMETNLTDFQINTYGSMFMQVFFYFITALPGFVFQFLPFMQRFKIQQNRELSLWEQWKCLRTVFFSKTFIYLPLIISLWYVVRYLELPITYTYDTMPSWYTLIPQLIASLMMEDTWHYFLHRFLHHPKLYGHIHKLHHTYNSPFAFASEYAHPIETTVLGIGFFIPMIFFCRHIIFFWAWLLVRMLQTNDVHTGYDFPYWNPLYLLPFYGGVQHHDFHHKNFTGNYASTFTYWDWLFGTDADFHKFKAKQQAEGHKKQQKKNN